jgi:predicted alpha/beta hydrolase family esterase
MSNNVLFIHGAGDGGYEADAMLATSLQNELGTAYKVHFPKMSQDETESFFGSQWPKQIGKEISSMKGEVILVGHSLGASMLMKYLSENKIKKRIAGVFLLATPFWSGDEDWVQPLKLREDFHSNLPKSVPIFFYQCKDDEEIPSSQFNLYKRNLPGGTFREIKSGGHQFNNDLSIVATDIKSL